MASLPRHKRRPKLATPANASFPNCVQDNLFAQPSRDSLDQFRPIVYLDEHGRRHGRVSDHLLQRQIESDRQTLKQQPKPKVPASSTLYGVRNPNIVALVRDVPPEKDNDADDEDDGDAPVADEVKMIEYKKPSSIIASATNRRQASSTSGRQSVRFDSSSFADPSKIVDSHLTGLDATTTIEADEDDRDGSPSSKPAVNLASASRYAHAECPTPSF